MSLSPYSQCATLRSGAKMRRPYKMCTLGWSGPSELERTPKSSSGQFIKRIRQEDWGLTLRDQEKWPPPPHPNGPTPPQTVGVGGVEVFEPKVYGYLDYPWICGYNSLCRNPYGQPKSLRLLMIIKCQTPDTDVFQSFSFEV